MPFRAESNKYKKKLAAFCPQRRLVLKCQSRLKVIKVVKKLAAYAPPARVDFITTSRFESNKDRKKKLADFSPPNSGWF